jgi:hypothetical protein
VSQAGAESDPTATASLEEASALRRVIGWRWPARFAIVQFPNLALAVALVASLAAGFTEGAAHRSLRAVSYLALGVWAYEEIRHGENWFRRALGTGFAIYLIASLTSALRA